ncbi:hypothetical protein LAZ67_1002407 [Cordylochernes scorpioides]|uniref:Uncharacterized protein n=1 Tax=Cordylochernes scorpioides TaxID=51811 RepID=A0ABY6JW92_9ARAC|nr:hypothetical protein LAZ67_1002407 [Cordylochernes scorpioides]
MDLSDISLDELCSGGGELPRLSHSELRFYSSEAMNIPGNPAPPQIKTEPLSAMDDLNFDTDFYEQLLETKDCTTLEQRAVIRFLNSEGIQTSQICQRMKNIYGESCLTQKTFINGLTSSKMDELHVPILSDLDHQVLQRCQEE